MQLTLTAATVNLDSGEVQRGHSSLHLTPSELGLLAFMVRQPEMAVSRDTLLEHVWGYRQGVQSRTVDTTIKTLRKKLERDPRQPDHLHTVRGVGYRFVGSRASSTVLVGRDEALGALLSALVPHSVVTLTGTAGIGKTALAREVLAHRDGVFVELGNATSADQVFQAVASVAGASAVSDAATLGRRMGDRSAQVWILDNGEQAITALADLLPLWREHTTVLVTSRVPVGIPAEVVFPVPELAPPAAIDLLRRRVGSATYTDSPESVLRAIAKQLDHNPLAIELIASRARWLPPEDVLERLKRPESLLPSGAGRHGSMEAALAWSFQSLNPDEWAILSAISVFGGPTDVPAIEAVAQSTPGQTMDALHTLEQAGWLHPMAKGRVSLRVLLRAFVRKQTNPGSALFERAAAHLVERFFDTHDIEGRLAFRDTARELAQRTLPDPLLAARLELVVADGFASTGPASARLEATERAVSTAPEEFRANALLARAIARHATGDSDVLGDLDAAHALASAQENPSLVARIVGRLGTYWIHRDVPEKAKPLLESALAMHRAVGDHRRAANRLANLGNVALRQARFDDAIPHFLEALAIHNQHDNAVAAAKVAGNIGVAYLRSGRIQRARSWFTQSRDGHARAGHTPGVMRMNGNLGNVAFAEGRLGDADRAFAEVERQATELEEPLIVGIASINRCSIAIERGDLAHAERHGASAIRHTGKTQARGYIATAAVLAALADWLDEPQEAPLQNAIASLQLANQSLALRTSGLLVARFGHDPAPLIAKAVEAEDRLTQEWLTLCTQRNPKAIRDFLKGPAGKESELRLVGAVWLTIFTV